MATKSGRTRWVFFLVAIALTGTGAWLAMSNRTLFEKGEEISLNLLASAERRDISSTLLLSGEVIPAFQVDVKSEVSGKVKHVHVETGQSVKDGDPLVTIDDTDLLTEKAGALTEIEGAELAVAKNRGNFERAKALYEDKLISKEVFANLEADYRIAENSLEKSKARLRTVEDKLSKTRILAPADGTVLDIRVNEGQVVVAAASVNSGTLLMTFADLSRLLIQTHVNQIDVSKVHTGQTVRVNMQGENTDPLTAHIEFVAPLATIRNNIKGFEVQALISENDDRLKPGMSVSMTVPVGEARGAVSVPISAVFRENKDRVVYVRKGQSTEKRRVTVGITDMSWAEIKSGVNEGEEILIVEPKAIADKS